METSTIHQADGGGEEERAESQQDSGVFRFRSRNSTTDGGYFYCIACCKRVKHDVCRHVRHNWLLILNQQLQINVHGQKNKAIMGSMAFLFSEKKVKIISVFGASLFIWMMVIDLFFLYQMINQKCATSRLCGIGSSLFLCSSGFKNK